jgi:hypothetical protein
VGQGAVVELGEHGELGELGEHGELGELGEHGAQVPLVEHDQVVETLPPEGAHEPLDHGVGLKRQLPWVRTVRDGSASRTSSTRCAASALSC